MSNNIQQQCQTNSSVSRVLLIRELVSRIHHWWSCESRSLKIPTLSMEPGRPRALLKWQRFPLESFQANYLHSLIEQTSKREPTIRRPERFSSNRKVQNFSSLQITVRNPVSRSNSDERASRSLMKLCRVAPFSPHRGDSRRQSASLSKLLSWAE